MSTARPRCPFCNNPLAPGATSCSNCGQTFTRIAGGSVGAPAASGQAPAAPANPAGAFNAPPATSGIGPSAMAPASSALPTLPGQPGAPPAPSGLSGAPPTWTPPPSQPSGRSRPSYLTIGLLAAVVVLLLVGVVEGVILISGSSKSSATSTPTVQQPTPTLAPSTTAATSPAVTPSPSPSPTVAPTATTLPGLIYSADWSNGDAGWTGPQDWQVTGGKLHNDGSSATAQSFIFAPQVSGMADYAIEVQVEVASYNPGPTVNFGFVVRATKQSGGYQAGIYPDQQGNLTIAAICCQSGKSFNPAMTVQTYRIEVQGNQITFLINKKVVSTLTSSLFPDGQQAGLFDEGVTLDVLSFEILQLGA